MSGVVVVTMLAAARASLSGSVICGAKPPCHTRSDAELHGDDSDTYNASNRVRLGCQVHSLTVSKVIRQTAPSLLPFRQP